MKSRYIYDHTGKKVYAEEGGKVLFDHRQPEPDAGYMIMPDIQPYQTVATDITTGKTAVINSRSEHRSFLKRNGYEEMGNDAPRPTKRVEMPSPKEFLRHMFNK